MKKIIIILLTVALVLSMAFFVKQANANNLYSNSYYSSKPDINWNTTDDIYSMVDFYDYAHGRVKIHGTIYGHSPDVGNYSTYILSKASVSIKKLGSFSDFVEFTDWNDVNHSSQLKVINQSDLKTINPIKINSTNGSIIFNNWSYSDDVIVRINSSVPIDGINFSSVYNYEPYYLGSTKYLHGYDEQGIIVNPGSEVSKIELVESSEQFTQLWRFTFSDENGEYEFDFLQPGTYEIEVNKIGYETSTRTIQVEEGSSQVDFFLEGSSYKANVIDRVITPFNDSVKHIREISGIANMTCIENAIISGSVGCEIIVEKNSKSQVVVYNDGLRINATNIEGNKVSLKISGEEDVTGKTVVVNVEGDFFDDHLNLIIEYDQEEIRMADDLDDVLTLMMMDLIQNTL